TIAGDLFASVRSNFVSQNIVTESCLMARDVWGRIRVFGFLIAKSRQAIDRQLWSVALSADESDIREKNAPSTWNILFRCLRLNACPISCHFRSLGRVHPCQDVSPREGRSKTG